MLRALSIFGLGSGFLLISPVLRASALNGLGILVFELGRYSPYSYILLALTLGAAAVWSLASPKPQ